jgi:hypothetical protein
MVLEALVSTTAVESHARKHHLMLRRRPAKGEPSHVREVHSDNVMGHFSVVRIKGAAGPAERPATHHFRSRKTITEMENRIRTLMTPNELGPDTKAKGDSVFILSSPPSSPVFHLFALLLLGATPTMPTLRIPDILGAMDGFELKTHPDERQISRETNEWFARFAFLFVRACAFRLTLVIIFSYNMLPRDKLDEFVKSEFGLLVGMAYPDTDATHLRVTSDYMAILFTYDDLMDLPSSDLMHDRMGADKAAKVMMSVLNEPDKFRPVAGLPVATAFHEYIILSTIAFDINLTPAAVSGRASVLLPLMACKGDLPKRPTSTCSLLATRSAIVSARSAPRSRNTSP